MPRIPEEELERVKRNTDLAALVRSRGIDLKKHGSRDLAGCCPFHEDNDPSFIVSPAKGLFHCMGCGAAGNAIQFVERFDKISFRHAYELLAEGGTAVFTASGYSAKQSSDVRRLENPFDPEASDADLMAQVVDYYHERLLKTPAALDYLKKRGLYHEEAITRFKLGFADRSLGLRLPNKSRVEGQRIRERLQQIGILRKSGHEHFNGSITVPIFDQEGNISEMYGRKITSNLRKGTPSHLYLPGPHRGIWNPKSLWLEEVILCEAPFDALTFFIHESQEFNYVSTTFIYGTQGFTDELFDAMVENNIRKVRLAYDNDDAGNRAAKRDAERLSSVGIEVYRIRFPLGMDANEYVTKVRGASLRSLIDGAEWMAGSSRAPANIVNESLAANLVANPEPVEAAEEKATLPEEVQLTLEKRGEYHFLNLGQREYRVGGLDKNNSLDVLKITLRIRKGDDFHLDGIDLAKDNDRRRFIERAHEETRLEKPLIKRDLGKLLLQLEESQLARLDAALEPSEAVYEMDPEERAAAMELLQSPNLTEQIGNLFDQCGLVGEEANRLAAYLACTSRKLARPLAVIIQSTSAAGKSILMESVLAMFPKEEQVKYSAMTGQSLYYLGEDNLKHRILAIVEEEGAEKASYALKLLQSEGELTIASTGKDPNTGRMETQEYHVEGPVMIFLTTTSIDIDEELQNRCLTLTVDESREQTERIHELQRKARTLEGLQLKQERRRVLTLMQNVQRLIDAIDIVNPFADRLTFTAERTRTRRDHEKYLTLIDAIALLHQHQRTKKKLASGTEYIEVIPADIELANQLAPELLGRSLDELPPQTRRVLELVKQIVRTRCDKEKMDPSSAWFSRREIREKLGWSTTQIRAHLERLREMEYIAMRSGRPGSTFQYELLTDVAEEPNPVHTGLIDAANLKVRHQPVGEHGNLSDGCRGGAQQVQPVEKPEVKNNLSACSVRTSGTAVLVES